MKRKHNILNSVLTGPILFLLCFVSCGGDKAGDKTGNSALSDIQKYDLVEVASSDYQWTGVAVSGSGRMFVNFPRWSANVPVSVAEIAENGDIIPYPDKKWNSWSNSESPDEYFVCVQSVFIDRSDFLWILDPGMVPGEGVREGAPKLLKVDLNSNSIIGKYYFDSSVAPASSYLNDVRINTASGYAYITDSGMGAIVVVNLESGESRRLLSDHPSTKAEDISIIIDGKKWQGANGETPKIHSDGIVLGLNNEYVYYQALTGRTLYRIRTEWLHDSLLSEAQLEEKVETAGMSGVSDGLACRADGSILVSAIEYNSVKVFTPDGKLQTVAQDSLLKWPDSFALTKNGTVYVTTSQIHLGSARTDPFKIFKLKPVE